jgi:hypothetical protein
MKHPFEIPASGDVAFTDYTRWRLKADDGGRHVWYYLDTEEQAKKWPQNTVDKYWLGLPTVRNAHQSEYCILYKTLFISFDDPSSGPARVCPGKGRSSRRPERV